MSPARKLPTPRADEWPWGRELILWGFAPSHSYTFKILEPRVGRAGCLSLQYHHNKSESWLVLRGEAWVLIITDGQVCTRILSGGDVLNLAAGVVHRVMALTPDLRVAEPSTPDAHAADKSAPKDVVRLHCVHGRECAQPRDAAEAALIRLAVQYTDEAISALEKGERPPQHNPDFLIGRGLYNLG